MFSALNFILFVIAIATCADVAFIIYEKRSKNDDELEEEDV